MSGTITNLPPEILSQIIETFCPVRSTSVLKRPRKWGSSKATSEVIRALSQTCRFFKKITESYLFSQITMSNYKAFCWRASRDPSIFESVRSLDDDVLEFVLTYRVDHTLDELPRQAEVYAAMEDGKMARDALRRLLPRLERFKMVVEDRELENWDDEEEYAPVHICDEFAVHEQIVELPKLQALDIVCLYSHLGIPCSHEVQGILIGSSPNLQRLRIDGQNIGAHRLRNETYFDQDGIAERYLAKMAPGLANLRVLEITDCLIDDGSFTLEYLRKFMALCTKLEKLELEVSSYGWIPRGNGPEYRPSPAQLIEAIGPLKKTLKHLILVPSEGWAAEKQGLIGSGQLSEFTQLRTLKMHEMCFCRKLISMGDGTDLGLVEMLPKCVEELVVVWHEGDTELADVGTLIARKDEFPVLKKVRVEVWQRYYRRDRSGGRVLLDRQ